MLILHLSGPTTSTTDRRAWNHRATASDREHCALPRRAHCRRGRRRPRTRTRTRPRLACRDELNKNRSSRKTDFQEGKGSSGSPILLKILSENRFSGKTYFYIIACSAGGRWTRSTRSSSAGSAAAAGITTASPWVPRWVAVTVKSLEFVDFLVVVQLIRRQTITNIS